MGKITFKKGKQIQSFLEYKLSETKLFYIAGKLSGRETVGKMRASEFMRLIADGKVFEADEVHANIEATVDEEVQE